MTTLRTRFQQYRDAGGIPDTPPWYNGMPRMLAFVGAAIVAVAGVITTIPLALLMLTGYAVFTPSGAGLAAYLLLSCLFLIFASSQLGLYVGGPLADYVLGVPREVEP